MNNKIKKLKIMFAGTSDFSKLVLNALIHSKYQITSVLTKSNNFSKRGKIIIDSPVKKIALQHNIPVFEPKSLSSTKIERTIKKLKANLMLVVAYGIIIPKNILEMFTFKCINIHGSLLPLWRGPAPIERSIINGDSKTGITTFYMNENIDSGNIIDSVHCAIDKNETGGSLRKKLSKIAIKCMLITLKKICTGSVKSIKQNNINASYAEKIKKEEGLLNWNLKAKTLHRIIRAFNPSPVAFFILNKKHIKVWKSEILFTSKKYHTGQIILINKEGLQISTTDNILNIQKLQFPGKKIINSIDCYNAYQHFFKIGEILQ